MTIRNLDDLVAFLTKFDVKDCPEKGFEADRVFYIPSDVNGDMRPTGTAWNFKWIIWYAGSVFKHENLKMLSPYLRDLERFVQILGELTGVDLQVDNGERASLRFIRALKDLQRHGELDSRPEIAKLRSIAREAEAIWKPELSHKVFMAELAKKNNLSERQLYRQFKTMKKLPDFKHYPWLNAVKSASTHKKSKREDISINTNR